MKSCPKCRYCNTDDRETCYICDTPLEESRPLDEKIAQEIRTYNPNNPTDNASQQINTSGKNILYTLLGIAVFFVAALYLYFQGN